ncbi:hypothetical protein EJ03DRAFT_332603 [Teratosphaeria nubilosa]|uniref:Uncharacterized protein n=1 Tax=Teratosphaeria nubilosa TaxID=161662 RepID=A0A6G1KSF7_9PEZI|nr:hypothetical protein EJ03DRAFT_332603 [Teratosphaeria nubilosa]
MDDLIERHTLLVETKTKTSVPWTAEVPHAVLLHPSQNDNSDGVMACNDPFIIHSHPTPPPTPRPLQPEHRLHAPAAHVRHPLSSSSPNNPPPQHQHPA